MKKNDLKRQVAEAINACQEKKAEEITILELEKKPLRIAPPRHPYPKSNEIQIGSSPFTKTLDPPENRLKC